MPIAHRIKQRSFIALFLIALAYPALAGTRTGLVSTGFASCVTETDCSGWPGCSDFRLEPVCHTACDGNLEGDPFCSGESSASATDDPWFLYGGSFVFRSGGDTPAGQATYEVEATRPDPTQLQVSFVISVFTLTGTFAFDDGRLEVSVFRFSGDPNVFDGLEIAGVAELISSGLIAEDDVLASDTLLYPDHGEAYGNLVVDVTGIPDDEIVLLAAESNSTSVPALSATGLLILALGVLATSTWAVWRRSGTGLSRVKRS